MLGSEQGVKDEAPLRVVLPTRKPGNLTVASRTPSSKALTVLRCAPELCSHHMPGGGKEEIKCPSLTFITFRFVMRLCHGYQTPDPPVRICPVRPIRHHCAALRGEREMLSCSNPSFTNPFVADVVNPHMQLCLLRPPPHGLSGPLGIVWNL